MDLTPFQKLLVARVFREKPASRALFEDFVSNQLRLGDCRMSADEIDAADKSDASFQRSAAIAEEHEVAREIPVTDEMKAAGAQELKVRISGCLISPEYWAAKVYRAMAAVAPTSFEPTDHDIRHLAIAMLAGAQDCAFAEAVIMFGRQPEHRQQMNLKAARAAFDHPGYLPSIAAARQDVANQTERRLNAWGKHADHIRVDRDNAQEMSERLTIENADLRDKLARKSEAAMRVSDDKDATIAALRAQLAAFVDPGPEPSKPNPFRDFLGDPRRIGGMS